ncbi:lanC-like protein 2 [Styela clava]
MVHDIERASHSFEKNDISVYTGISGYALLYLHLYKIFQDEKYIETAQKYIASALKRLKGRRMTFLCGDAGPLAIGAVVYHTLGRKEDSKTCVNNLLAMLESVLPLDQEIYDEMLYGRAGYLYSLLYVRKHVENSGIKDEAINRVIHSIIESGKLTASNKQSAALSYAWHGSEYIGAAHGYIGILYTLLCTNYQTYQDDIKSTIDFVLGIQYPSGNFPSSFGSDNDRLIHWCHGAPGGVYLMMKAHEIFGEEKYLESACKASDTVWNHGLLKKGYGICHGTSGNGYGFLALYKYTKDAKYLYRAVQFGLWCCGYRERHGLNTPDRPYSLFEGIAGAAYFLADLLSPNNAKFPAFEL